MKTPDVLWTHYMLHIVALTSKITSEELKDALTKAINYVKISPIKVRQTFVTIWELLTPRFCTIVKNT